MSSVETIIVVLGIIAYSVGRQIAGEPLRVKRLIGLPAALTVIGIVDVARAKGQTPTHLDLVLIGVGCAVNTVIGICQGRLMRLESRNGYLWGQMPKSVLWWWAAKIASGLVLDGMGHALGAQLATVSSVMLLELGVNRLAQAAIVAPRAFATGIPFTPEPDKHGAGQKGQSRSEKNTLLAEIRNFVLTVFDDGRLDRTTYLAAFRQPGTSPIEVDPSGPTTSPHGTVDSSPTTQTSPPSSMKRQITQMVLREINDHIDDAGE